MLWLRLAQEPWLTSMGARFGLAEWLEGAATPGASGCVAASGPGRWDPMVGPWVVPEPPLTLRSSFPSRVGCTKPQQSCIHKHHWWFFKFSPVPAPPLCYVPQGALWCVFHKLVSASWGTQSPHRGLRGQQKETQSLI